ncbi:MAG TPA: UDP-2,3-diacylglucosamine diphosphatase [Quisquiliibacterium sp.]|nr:UDP-2,3-diacylglucosamine diphosphatase [Quisquiliibacterium sp.]
MPHVRTIFLSDIHLGTRACQAERLLEFLKEYSSDHLFLIGDIVDFWGMARGVYWTPAQNTVVQKILRRARHGAQVTVIPGNHDEALRDYVDSHFGGIRLLREHVHELADRRRFLLTHGDEFDAVTRYHRWVALLGDVAYTFLVRQNIWLSWVRRQLGRPGYWSLAGYAKRKVKSALQFIFDFEESVIRAARERGLDGVVCGHIHWAAIRDAGGITYVNCGDWVDSCTAIVEHLDGRLELVQWHGPVEAQATASRAHAAAGARAAAGSPAAGGAHTAAGTQNAPQIPPPSAPAHAAPRREHSDPANVREAA